ncbi:RDD family protein [compost metagenome]
MIRCPECGIQNDDSNDLCMTCATPLDLLPVEQVTLPASPKQRVRSPAKPLEKLTAANLMQGSPRDSTNVSGPGVIQKKARPSIYAGFWRRFIARSIDYILVSYPLNLLFSYFKDSSSPVSPFPFIMGSVRTSSSANDIFTFDQYTLIQSILLFLYEILMMTSSRQGTLGKMIMSIQITNSEGRPVSINRAIARYFAMLLSVITLGIGSLMCAWTAKKQALHDKAAGTLVVKKPRTDLDLSRNSSNI